MDQKVFVDYSREQCIETCFYPRDMYVRYKMFLRLFNKNFKQMYKENDAPFQRLWEHNSNKLLALCQTSEYFFLIHAYYNAKVHFIDMNAALNSMVYDTVLLNMLYLVIVYSFFINIILEVLVY